MEKTYTQRELAKLTIKAMDERETILRNIRKTNQNNLKTHPYELFNEQGDFASHGVFESIEEAHGAAEYDKLSKYSIWQENGDKVFDNSSTVEKDFTIARLSKMSKVELIFQTITWIEKGCMETQQLENLRELLKREKEEIETRMKIPGLKIK